MVGEFVLLDNETYYKAILIKAMWFGSGINKYEQIDK